MCEEKRQNKLAVEENQNQNQNQVTNYCKIESRFLWRNKTKKKQFFLKRNLKQHEEKKIKSNQNRM